MRLGAAVVVGAAGTVILLLGNIVAAPDVEGYRARVRNLLRDPCIFSVRRVMQNKLLPDLWLDRRKVSGALPVALKIAVRRSIERCRIEAEATLADYGYRRRR